MRRDYLILLVLIMFLSTLVYLIIAPILNQPPTQRAKVLESNTITLIQLTPIQSKLYKLGDTVWVNLTTHCIDDTSNTTMKSILIP